MTTERENWRRARELFHGCLDLEPGERDAFLARACGGDEGLRQEVLSLLEYHQDDETLLAIPAAQAATEPGEGEEIERYRLIEKIGQGGMGVVYRARRADGVYDDEVAVKLLPRGGDLAGEERVERFRRERQILANLKHPAIASLLDGGTASDGRPFLVMELVDGTPIDRYCDEQRLDVRGRIELFIEVCRAVQFAHRSLVVHRDLKPANLLVSTEGRPKLLDFGVAKLLGDSDEPDLTVALSDGSGSPLTPDYASPEQVTGGAITTGSDVYSLGVILYVLLCGRKPLVSRGLSLAQFVESLSHEEPPPPSRRLRSAASESPEDSSTLAAARSARDGETLIRQLSGDLDRIVSMALRKDPVARYASVEDLARDLQRYLEDLPVLAREQTVSYRLGKFLTRHRWPVLASAAILAVVLALIAGLVRQRDRLLEEQALSVEVTGFLEGLFENADPGSGGQGPVTARELLDQGARDIPFRFAEQPRTRSRLVSTIGRAYLNLGALDDAETHLEESLEIRRRLWRSEVHPEVSEALLDLGELRRMQGDYGEATRLFVKSEEAEPGASPRPLEIRRLRARAGVLRIEGDYGGAGELLERALELADERYGSDDPRYAEVLMGLGELERTQGEDVEKAQALYERARQTFERAYGELYPRVARLDVVLGLLLEKRGLYAEAEAKYRLALAGQKRIYPDGHPSEADTLNNLASVVYRQGRLEEAEELCREGLALRRERFDGDHPSIPHSLNLLGLILHARGSYDAAEKAYAEAETLFLASLGPDHVQLASVLSNTARTLVARELFEAAEVKMREALRIYRAALGGGSPSGRRAAQQSGLRPQESGRSRNRRAALPPGAGDPRTRPGPRAPARGDRRQQPGRPAARPRRAGTGGDPLSPGFGRPGPGTARKSSQPRRGPQDPGRESAGPGSPRRGGEPAARGPRDPPRRGLRPGLGAGAQGAGRSGRGVDRAGAAGRSSRRAGDRFRAGDRVARRGQLGGRHHPQAAGPPGLSRRR
ncbi:MAG: tetratricopeptide repeat protein [Acidobacteriota bacterium]